MSVEIAGRLYSWSAQHGNRQPFRLVEPDREQCAFCGTSTLSGIYVRVDPRTVALPTPEPEGDS